MRTEPHVHPNGHGHGHVHGHVHADGHGHGHVHGDGHVHAAAVVEAEPVDVPEPHSSPVLDIGGDVGAMVVYLGARTRSGELEACPVGAPADRFHTGVHHRAIARGFAWTAVFPEVFEGSYHLLDDDGRPLAALAVTGGEVAELDLR